VEVLTSYSHTPQVPELQLCVNARQSEAVKVARPASGRPWSLRDRLDERTRADLIAAYHAGATAASLAAHHGLSLRSVKRLLAAAGVRRKLRSPDITSRPEDAPHVITRSGYLD
jgi:hypothetical protein